MDNILDFYKRNDKIEIEFVDRTKILFNETYESFQKQYQKARRLQEKIKNNKMHIY